MAVRNIIIWTIVAAVLLFGMGFAVTTPAHMPDYALVYLDKANSTYLAPECVPAWKRHTSDQPRQLLRSNAGDARQRGFTADSACAQLGAFTPPGASISRGMLEHAGLLGPQRQWWDAPYRTEEGMIYPPNTQV